MTPADRLAIMPAVDLFRNMGNSEIIFCPVRILHYLLQIWQHAVYLLQYNYFFFILLNIKSVVSWVRFEAWPNLTDATVFMAQNIKLRPNIFRKINIMSLMNIFVEISLINAGLVSVSFTAMHCFPSGWTILIMVFPVILNLAWSWYNLYASILVCWQGFILQSNQFIETA